MKNKRLWFGMEIKYDGGRGVYDETNEMVVRRKSARQKALGAPITMGGL